MKHIRRRPIISQHITRLIPFAAITLLFLFTLLAISPAQAEEISNAGLSFEVGISSFAATVNSDSLDLTFSHTDPILRMIASDGSDGSFLDLDLTLLFAAVLQGFEITAGGYDPYFPDDSDGQPWRFFRGDLLRFRGVSAENPINSLLSWGFNAEFTLGTTHITPVNADAGFVEIGGKFILLGFGPTLRMMPLEGLEIFISPEVLAIGSQRSMQNRYSWGLALNNDIFYNLLDDRLWAHVALDLDQRRFPESNDIHKSSVFNVIALRAGLVFRIM